MCFSSLEEAVENKEKTISRMEMLMENNGSDSEKLMQFRMTGLFTMTTLV